MNNILWILQVALAVMVVMAGVIKAFEYKKAKERMDWVNDVPKGFVILIGFSEILIAIGLLFPMALGILPKLTPIAAFALVVLMMCAAIFHYKRKEFQMIPFNVILLLMALFITIGRLYF